MGKATLPHPGGKPRYDESGSVLFSPDWTLRHDDPYNAVYIDAVVRAVQEVQVSRRFLTLINLNNF